MTIPSADLFCPVCGRDLEFITVWQEPATNRIRLFCERCSHQEGYRDLPKEERRILSLAGFQRFAAERQLRNAWLKEHPQNGSGSAL